MIKITYSVMFLLFITAFTNETHAQSDWRAPKEADALINPLNGDAASEKRGKKA